MKFSERMGYTLPRTVSQTDDIDEPLKNAFWTCLYETTFHYIGINYRSDNVFCEDCEIICRRIWLHFLNKTSDSMPSWNKFANAIKTWFYSNDTSWYEIYDLIEFIISGDYDKIALKDVLISGLNSAMEQHMSGYRIIGTKVTPITDKEETNELVTAIEDNPFNNVKSHIQTAVEYFANRDNPDYRNVIKEAISAVEAICRIIVGNESATLSNALAKIEKSIDIHPALKLGYEKIYCYTNDADGIRHALGIGEDDTVAQENARYMLVSCSAFVNYLIEKYRKMEPIS